MPLCFCRQTFRRKRQIRDCQNLLEKLKREQSVAAATHQYPASSCPVCLDDFEPPVQQPLPNSKADAQPSAPPLSTMQVP
jgi:hypothetical protein